MNNLKKIREEKNKKQNEIAKYLQIKQQQYSRYETYYQEPSIDKYKQLALYYNTSIDYLVGLTEEKKPYPRVKEKEKT